MGGFTIQEKSANNAIVLVCAGAIDYSNFDHGNDAVKKIIEKGNNRIIFDLGAVTYISSSGWTIFLGNLRAAREKGGDIILTNMIPEVKYTFKLLELDNLMDYFDTVEDAVKRMT